MAHTNVLEGEIEAMEKGIYSKPTEKKAAVLEVEPKVEPTESTESKVELEPEGKKQEEVIVESEVKPKDKKQDEKTDWEKRFKNFKASSDATVHGLRQENVSLREHITKLDETVRTLGEKVNEASLSKSNSVDRLFTQEEQDMLGEDTVKALIKVNQATIKSQVDPLKDQLKAEREKRASDEKKSLEDEKKNLQQNFLTRLGNIVSDYSIIDRDPRFLKWMEEADHDSGYPRKIIFKRAQSANDVGRVAEFFLKFKESIKPVDKLEGKITPEGEQGGSENKKPVNKQPVFTPQYISNFYDEVVRGKWRGRDKERQEMETAIDNHLRLSAQR